jgi:hypothetical protein
MELVTMQLQSEQILSFPPKVLHLSLEASATSIPASPCMMTIQLGRDFLWLNEPMAALETDYGVKINS